MNLYQIDSAIAECVDAESGEVLDFDKLAELSMERDRKIENIALWIKNDLSEAKAIREEEKSLAARRQSLERAAESKKHYLESVLNGEKFSTAKCSVSFRNTTSVEIDDMAAAVALDAPTEKKSWASLLWGGQYPGIWMTGKLSK